MKNKLRPIETAPKDGTFIYLYGDSGYITFPYRVVVGHWVKGFRDFWIDVASDAISDSGDDPLFWSPILVSESEYNEAEQKNKESEKEQEWIFTFCQDHEYPNGFVKIYGTLNSSRQVMFDHFGGKWGFQYPTKEKAGVDRFQLKEVKLF